MFLTFWLFNVPGCCVHELLCDDVCCAMRLFVFEFVFNVFVWFVCDSLCDVVWSVLSCFCCNACLYAVVVCFWVCLNVLFVNYVIVILCCCCACVFFSLNVLMRFVCDLLCDGVCVVCVVCGAFAVYVVCVFCFVCG